MRLSSCALVLLFFSTLVSADLKIKTRTTVMGHSSESTVYIKGARQRTEMTFGGHGGAVSIMQCDQKRMITVSGNQCMVMSMGGDETSCPAMPNMASLMKGELGGDPTPPSKGGVVTITRNSTDTGERQELFGYKARHIKSSMTMESSPDACNKSHMKMEIDGWYADLSTGFSCGDESYRAMACGGPGNKRGCSDRIVMKGGGAAALGYPLKQTMTMTSEQGTFTTTTEVVELASATLDAPLFDMPAGCHVMDMSALMGKAPHADATPEPTPTATAAKTPEAAPAPPAPTLAPKTAGVMRIGVVKIKDLSGQGLPTENLLVNLLSEFSRQQLEPVVLDADSPQQSVEAEARAKQCDYFVYTVAHQVTDPGSEGLTGPTVPKAAKLDHAKYQALSGVTLYKVGKPLPEIKDLSLAADAAQFAVDAVTATFVMESDKVAAQIADDAHSKTSKAAPAKPAAAKPKTK